MRMKLGIADFTYFLSRRSGLVDEFMLLEKAAHMKLDCVQVNLGLRFGEEGKQWRSKLKDKAQALGLELIGAAFGGQEKERDFGELLSAGKELGVKFIRYAFGPFMLKKVPLPEEELLKILTSAAVLAESAGIPIAVENHQDYLSDRFAGIIEKVGSPYVGVMLDTGNSIALLEDPMVTAEILAPYTIGVHLKEYAVLPAAGGFDLVGVALGQGVIDNASIMELLKEKSKRNTMYVAIENPLERCSINLLSSAYVDIFKDKPIGELKHVAGFIEESLKKYPEGIVLPNEAGYDDRKIAACEDEHNIQAVEYARSIVR